MDYFLEKQGSNFYDFINDFMNTMGTVARDKIMSIKTHIEDLGDVPPAVMEIPLLYPGDDVVWQDSTNIYVKIPDLVTIAGIVIGETFINPSTLTLTEGEKLTLSKTEYPDADPATQRIFFTGLIVGNKALSDKLKNLNSDAHTLIYNKFWDTQMTGYASEYSRIEYYRRIRDYFVFSNNPMLRTNIKTVAHVIAGLPYAVANGEITDISSNHVTITSDEQETQAYVEPDYQPYLIVHEGQQVTYGDPFTNLLN